MINDFYPILVLPLYFSIEKKKSKNEFISTFEEEPGAALFQCYNYYSIYIWYLHNIQTYVSTKKVELYRSFC